MRHEYWSVWGGYTQLHSLIAAAAAAWPSMANSVMNSELHRDSTLGSYHVKYSVHTLFTLYQNVYNTCKL